MKTVSRLAAQGDVIFKRVSELPKDATEVKGKSARIVAHSETGHHHTVEGKGVRVFSTPDPLKSFLVFTGPHADIVHRRSWDTHETLRLLRGDHEGEVVFEIGRQREWAPEGWRRVED